MYIVVKPELVTWLIKWQAQLKSMKYNTNQKVCYTHTQQFIGVSAFGQFLNTSFDF